MADAEDWKEIDELWDASLERAEVPLEGSEFRCLDQTWGVQSWLEVDTWWDGYTTGQIPILNNSKVWGLVAEGTNEWGEIDLMWVPYAKNQQQQFRSLNNVFDEINGEWKQGSSRFNRDPLVRDTRHMRSFPGPLRSPDEIDWSHWLASLLRNSKGEFARRLLGEQFNTSPRSVRREVRFDNPDGKNRRVDILVEYDHGGSMIEVKIDDTDYEKTLETACLVEDQKRGIWNHVLLLPDSRSMRLDRTFAEKVVYDDGEPRRIKDKSREIRVLYWKDVSRTLRQTLISDVESDPHWESSAYVFISLIEQQICSFDPLLSNNNQPAGEDTGSDDFLFSDIKYIGQNDFDSRITHMQRTTEEDDG